MPLVKVIRNGQITLPKSLRDRLGIREGDLLEVTLTKSGMSIVPKTAVDSELARTEFFKMVKEFQVWPVIRPGKMLSTSSLPRSLLPFGKRCPTLHVCAMPPEVLFRDGILEIAVIELQNRIREILRPVELFYYSPEAIIGSGALLDLQLGTELFFERNQVRFLSRPDEHFVFVAILPNNTVKTLPCKDPHKALLSHGAGFVGYD